MKKKQLGNTDLKTAPIVFGANVFGWTLDQQESFKMLDAIVEAGIDTIDTANTYGSKVGESETIIGKWMKDRGNRAELNIITKVGSNPGRDAKDLSEDHILKAADESLKRLQIDQIDLYFSHWDDESTPVEETLGAYQQLKDAGKARNIGASNFSPRRLKASLEASQKHHLPRYEVFQPEYNLYERQGYEQGVAPICNSEKLGVIPYFSLASGFLTGKYRGKEDLKGRERADFVKKYLNKRGFRILNALDDLAVKYDTSQAAVALGWLIHRSNVTAPIASATSKQQLQAFVDAMDTALDEDDMEKLNEASSY